MIDTLQNKSKSRSIWPDRASVLSDAQKQSLHEALFVPYQHILHEEAIDASPAMLSLLESLYLPLSAWIAAQHGEQPLVIGINGGQGSGKSTLTRILSGLLSQGFDKKVLSLSIDDLYFGREQRQQLAKKIHPLFVTRGVPGTHDIELAKALFTDLKSRQQKSVKVPVFDKAIDDQRPASDWKQIQTPVDIVLFEGWCVGSIAQTDDELESAINSLERDEDSDKIWRRYVNEQLAGPYQQLFSQIDVLMMLKVPGMEKVREWRLLQEQKLMNATENRGSGIMSEADINRFIMHYERITQNTLKEMPARANVVMELDDTHRVCHVNVKQK